MLSWAALASTIALGVQSVTDGGGVGVVAAHHQVASSRADFVDRRHSMFRCGASAMASPTR